MRRGLSVLLPVLLFLLASCAGANGRADIDPAVDYIVRLAGEAEPFRVVTGDEVNRLLAEDALLWYEEDAALSLMDGESAYYESYQWNLTAIGADRAFARGYAGQGIRVGVLDSGVNPHPDFESRLLPGRCYIENAKDPDDTSDSFGHGTKVAGLLAGAGEHGCVGAAPMAQIVPLKCTDGQSVRVSALCRAIYGGIDDFGCRVLNLSLGIATEYHALAEAAAYAEERGVVLVASVGNGGVEKLNYPAAYGTVIGVGAVGRDGISYERSNHNESVFLTAPGVEVRTTDARGGYSPVTGCSFAVPQVAGAAAVLLSADGSLTPAGIRECLAAAAKDAGGAGYDEYYGYGILDLASSLTRIAGEAEARGPRCEFLPAGEGAATTVRNCTGEALCCTYILAEYDGRGACVNTKTETLTVPAYGEIRIAAPDGTRRYAQFLTDGDGIPLCPARGPR